LGISSGATLGVALLVMGFAGVGAGGILISGNWAVAISAWIGAGAVLLLIMVVSARVRDIMTILILGIMFGSATAAVVTILQYFSPASSLKAFVVWTMGSLSGVTHQQLQVVIPAITIGLFITFFSVKNLNALLLGENYARSMGMNVKTTRFFVFLSTSLLAGTVTAFCGPIGFIGIAIPHLVRIIFNSSNHQLLMPGTLILGGNAMLISDIVSQLPGSATTLPVNSITALLGIPVVIWIILRRRVNMFT
jgi:iron complex transport system permease protein